MNETVPDDMKIELGRHRGQVEALRLDVAERMGRVEALCRLANHDFYKSYANGDVSFSYGVSCGLGVRGKCLGETYQKDELPQFEQLLKIHRALPWFESHVDKRIRKQCKQSRKATWMSHKPFLKPRRQTDWGIWMLAVALAGLLALHCLAIFLASGG